jgi:hypothetical protein
MLLLARRLVTVQPAKLSFEQADRPLGRGMVRLGSACQRLPLSAIAWGACMLYDLRNTSSSYCTFAGLVMVRWQPGKANTVTMRRRST